MAPHLSTISIAAFSDEDYVNDNFHFWNHVYGFDMSPMKASFKVDGKTEYLAADKVISTSALVKTIDTNKTTVKQLDFDSEFELEFEKEDTCHGLVGWFDFFFPSDEIMFSTKPGVDTHWKQTLFLFNQSFKVKKGDKLSGRFRCEKYEKNHRELVVNLVCLHISADTEELKIEQMYYVRT